MLNRKSAAPRLRAGYGLRNRRRPRRRQLDSRHHQWESGQAMQTSQTQPSRTGKAISRVAFCFSRAGKAISRPAFCLSRTGKAISCPAFCFSRTGKAISRPAFRFSAQEKQFPARHFAFPAEEKRFPARHFAFPARETRFPTRHFAFPHGKRDFPLGGIKFLLVLKAVTDRRPRRGSPECYCDGFRRGPYDALEGSHRITLPSRIDIICFGFYNEHTHLARKVRRKIPRQEEK